MDRAEGSITLAFTSICLALAREILLFNMASSITFPVRITLSMLASS